MANLRIAEVITGCESLGGAETHVRDLVTELKARGCESCVFVGPPWGVFHDQLVGRGIQVQALRWLRKPIRPDRDIAALIELIRAIARFKPDLIAAHTAKACFLGRLAAQALGLPCVITPHGLSVVNRKSGEIDPLFLFLERVLGRVTSRIIAVCDQERSLAESLHICDTHRLSLVYNGIPDHPVRGDPGADPCTLVMIARFQEPKDHCTLLRALKLIETDDWRARLVGTGPRLQSVRDEARYLGLTSRVEFIGQHSDPTQVLASAQILVLSSRSEAFPISILEGMRAGLPVVATRVGGIPQAVEDGVNGFLVTPGDSTRLAGRLRELLDNKQLRSSFGRHSREKYLQLFTADRMTSETLQSYEEVVASHRSVTQTCRVTNTTYSAPSN